MSGNKSELASVDIDATREIFSEATLKALVETIAPVMQRGGRTLAYMLPAASRIGHMCLEPFLLRNFFGESHQNIAAIIHDRRFQGHSAGVRRLHEPRIDFLETMNRKLVMMGHFNASPVDIGPLTWAVISPSALFRDFVLHLERGGSLEHLAAPEDLIAEGRAKLANMGFGDDRPSVVLHVRDTGYLPGMAYHHFRASRIETYRPAIDHLVAKGFRVFRLGDPSSVPLDHDSDLVVDLPRHPDYSDILDVTCMAEARFAITCSSGPEAIARILNKPMVMVNGYSQPDHWLNAGDQLLFKTYRDKKSGRPIGYDEMLGRDLFLLNTVEGFEQAEVVLEDNSPEEILDAVIEMEARLDGSFEPDAALEARFTSLSESHLARYRTSLPERGPEEQDRFETYAYALPWTRYCQSFMRKNPWFLA
ncbi:TIGR04372 family glycosyltransferase [Nisaea acidiphila]|uniref:TIGR04372 family glycosyltransferase n=1 Tax=Nisaea acidiphila TaxID=1862145 RepID=A0A9J7AT18_9PROT|nr:TIGR04372 family glycosyltransferase [Nisaea acidiphila]UUX48509.1 TIGR04372 family glycosyltransferase [Nisaea acidiphila]